jgi:endonuclease-3
LMAVIPQNRWTMACHQLVFHGRKICIARKPKCSACPVATLCPQVGVILRE